MLELMPLGIPWIGDRSNSALRGRSIDCSSCHKWARKLCRMTCFCAMHCLCKYIMWPRKTEHPPTRQLLKYTMKLEQTEAWKCAGHRETLTPRLEAERLSEWATEVPSTWSFVGWCYIVLIPAIRRAQLVQNDSLDCYCATWELQHNWNSLIDKGPLKARCQLNNLNSLITIIIRTIGPVNI